MLSLPKIKADIERELAEFPKESCDQFGDDTVVRLNHERQLLQKLLAVTDGFIREQAALEHRLEAYI
ncbi:MAG: hypothetical protein P4N41_12105 [Negativicutes bacterium]|nr:hypothetical protein [Negativicutes bacterium]